jgi:transposase InsO family protein
MNIHKLARLTPHSREVAIKRVVEGGVTQREVARAFGVSLRTIAKWVKRFREEGADGLLDRSSRPRRIPNATPAETVALVEALRRDRWTGKSIAKKTGLSRATVSRILRRLKLSRSRDLDPPEPPNRYQREHPGELIHIDIKKLGRFYRPGHRVTGDRRVVSSGAGWEYVHVCIDDRSRISFADIYPDETSRSVVAFLKQVVARYKRLGVTVKGVMTDNGPGYLSGAFAKACRELGLRHIRTRPYRPRTNGKAERFIKTALAEWAYGATYETSEERAAALPVWLHRYNWHRPHGSLDDEPPISVLGLNGNNLVRLHS